MNKNLLIIGLIVAVIAFGLGLYVGRITTTIKIGGTTRSDTTVDANFAVTGTTALTGNTTIAGTVSSSVVYTPSLIVGNGSSSAYHRCTATSWNPSAVTSTSPQSVDITMPTGYTIGDRLSVSLATSTLKATLNIVASSSTIATAILSTNLDGSLDVATTTLTACADR